MIKIVQMGSLLTLFPRYNQEGALFAMNASYWPPKIWKMVHLCNFDVDLGHHYGICENFEILTFIVSECVVDLFSSP